ncbi:hypothetical protein DSO57_1025771 [Entomophthora muscae]|uniref:Uncharacterized protein n=2 Tax=Entomophthora muscae TaxID=34485 RepID=A0ACC2TP21_9FUNG|nr:hypothetical protein DSO57_1024779 [Entomophthora muscae]KAJ9076480.1 hypothetical protein DSO57_1025771 [Entomophthora muscae]
MDIILVPSQARGKVTLIEKRQESITCAGPGDRVGLHVEGLTARQVRRGYVCCDATVEPLLPIKEFVAQIAVLSGASSLGCIEKGLKVRLDCHNTYADVTFDLIYPRDLSTDGRSDTLNPGDVGCVRLVSDKQIALEIFSTCPSLGRFALRHKSHTIAVGLVIENKLN